MTKFILAALAFAALATAGNASDMPQGCVHIEEYLMVAEENPEVDLIGVFGPETGMQQSGELVKHRGVTYVVEYNGEEVCVSPAEPSTRYLVSPNG